MNPTTAEAKRWVVTSLVLVAIVAATGQVAEGHVPQLRIAIGAAFAAVLLTLLAEAAPGVAVGLALTVLAATLLARDAVLARLSTIL